MRPIRLEIEGLRSFRKRQVIDFQGRDYFAIVGDTGSGKSSILEALTFALYGRTTFTGQGNQELMNASSTALRVFLEFDVGGERWEVARVLRRSGAGKVSNGSASLRRIGDGGEPLESYEGVREVTSEVEATLGLDVDAFLRTVVLPQGQFSRLLVDDDQKSRASVLRQIWRTDELAQAGAAAKGALSELGPLRGRVEQALEGLPEDLDAHLTELGIVVDDRLAALERSREKEDRATRAAEDLKAAAATIERVDSLVDKLSEWDGAESRRSAAKIKEAELVLTASSDDVERQLAAAQEPAEGANDLQRELDDLAPQLEAHDKNKAEAAHRAARAAIEEAMRAAPARELAHGLHAGDRCPVCDQNLPDGWEPPAATEIRLAQESLEEAGKNLDAALAVLAKRQRILDKYEERRSVQRREIDSLTSRRQKLDRDRRAQVQQPANQLWRSLVVQRSELQRFAEVLDEQVVVPELGGDLEVGDLAGLVEDISHVTVRLLAKAQNATEEARSAASAAQDMLRELAIDLSMDATEIRADRIVKVLSDLTGKAGLDHRSANERLDTFRRRIPAINALRSGRELLDRKYLALSDLAAALNDGAFPKWLTLRRSRSLLVHASRLLSEITAGRYAFAELDDDESQWLVFDSNNGQTRSPASLSGGEKFVASLALALGMVEMLGRQGDRIESLFLDEGFGALDRTNLDAAIEALGSVAATGRMVAVITHLRSVAEQITQVLAVSCEPTGTQATWLDESERSSLISGDLDVPSGLLD